MTYDDHLVWPIHVPRRCEPLITPHLSLWGNARTRATFPTHKKSHNPHPQGGGGEGGQDGYITLGGVGGWLAKPGSYMLPISPFTRTWKKPLDLIAVSLTRGNQRLVNSRPYFWGEGTWGGRLTEFCLPLQELPSFLSTGSRHLGVEELLGEIPLGKWSRWFTGVYGKNNMFEICDTLKTRS